jgi:D-serine deaminase-like pyridoxal phosphate-dependent protein
MNLYDLDTPALIVDLDRLERNIAQMAALARENNKRLRPHTKTHKTPEIARMQVQAGARGLTVAKLGEAEVMAGAGLDDLFIANQIVGAPKIARLMALLQRARVTVGVDSLACAVPLSEAGERAGLRVPVRMEVDTGLHRAGGRTVEEAVTLGIMLAGMPGLELDGIFTHEGHAYRGDAEERAAACAAAAAMMRHIAAGLRASGVPIAEVSVGSTPGASFMAREEGVTEIRPGVYVFNDAVQTGMGVEQDDCALTVLATVISRPEERIAILDAGTKALSGDRAPEGSRHGIVLEDPAVVFDWASEEHGHLDLTHARLRPRVGDKLRVIPWHACACVNMHDTLYAVRGETVEAEWPIAARGKMR